MSWLWCQKVSLTCSCRTLVIIFLLYSRHEEVREDPWIMVLMEDTECWAVPGEPAKASWLQCSCSMHCSVFRMRWSFRVTLGFSVAFDLSSSLLKLRIQFVSVLSPSFCIHLFTLVFIATLVLKIFQRFAEVRHICYNPITCTNDANTSVKQDENRRISLKKVKQPRRNQ